MVFVSGRHLCKYGGPVPMFQAQELWQNRSTRTMRLFHMRGQWIWRDSDLLWSNGLICLGPWRLSQCLLGCGWRICSCMNEHLWTFSGIGDACSWRYIALAVQQIVKRKIIPIILQKRKKIWMGGTLEHFPCFISYSYLNCISGHF